MNYQVFIHEMKQRKAIEEAKKQENRKKTTKKKTTKKENEMTK